VVAYGNSPFDKEGLVRSWPLKVEGPRNSQKSKVLCSYDKWQFILCIFRQKHQFCS
jgi:hypothetical protein